MCEGVYAPVQGGEVDVDNGKELGFGRCVVTSDLMCGAKRTIHNGHTLCFFF